MKGNNEHMTDHTDSAGPQDILLNTSNGIATITLNRPKRKNAMTMSSWRQLGDTISRVHHDPDIQAVILTGAGHEFCSGADLSTTPDPDHPLTRMNYYSQLVLALYNMPKPVIAQVDGIAAGAGCNLALGCDFVVATPRARFSQIFVKRGLSLDFGGSWLLPRIVGMQQAKRLALLGDIIDVAEAHRIGMVTWVQPEGEIDTFVLELASRLTEGPPIALALNKTLLHEASYQDLNTALNAEARSQLVNFATDGPIAKQAFVTRTDPTFQGRWQV